MKYILFILLIINIILVINVHNDIKLNSRLNYEAMICLEDPDCTLELD